MKSLFMSVLGFTVLFCVYTGLAQDSFPLEGTSLYFVKNNGQLQDTKGNRCYEVGYVAESKDMKIYFTKQGVSYVFGEESPERKKDKSTIDTIYLRYQQKKQNPRRLHDAGFLPLP